VLGPFQALDTDATPIDFSHRKVQALLAYLAVEHSRSQTREHLASLLWARTGEERARHNLRQALSRLRSLCADMIQSGGDGVALNTQSCLIDVLQFEGLARSDDEQDLRKALDLYRGELMEGYNSSEEEYQDWLLVERVRLRKLACQVASRLADLLIGQNRTTDAIDVLNRLLRFDRANESTQRALIQLLAESGQRSEALRQYQECEAALIQELGVKPGPQTQQLYEAIREGRPIGSAASQEQKIQQPDLLSGGPARVQTLAVLVVDMDGHDQIAQTNQKNQLFEGIAAHVSALKGQLVTLPEHAVAAFFTQAREALTCAQRIQRENAGSNRAAGFRMGIDLGDAGWDGTELRGDALNVATRLAALATNGGVCVSDAVRQSNESKTGFQFIGEQRARNVGRAILAYRVARQSVAAAVPSLELPGKPSIIIKPFSNMSADIQQDYFAEGLTKDISIALTKIPGLFLAEDATPQARFSEGMTATDMGRQFGVRYVLSGGVRRAGQRVRVNAELIDASNGQCLWGERYDRELHDLFAIQDEITEEIVTTMDVKLVQGEAARFMRKALTNPAALEASYRGWYALYHGTSKQDVFEAQRLFEEVIRLQPESPLGYASAALAYWAEAGFGRVVISAPAMRHAVELASKALDLGDTTGYAHLVMAIEHLARHEFDAAMEQASEGVAARPNCNGAYAIKSMVLNFLGQPQEAIEFAQYAVRLTPVYPAEFPFVLAASYHDSGRYSEAITAAQASLKLRADDIDPMLFMAAANVAQGSVDEARQIAAEVLSLEPSFHLREFAKTQPYKNARDLSRLIDRLRQAGLPE